MIGSRPTPGEGTSSGGGQGDTLLELSDLHAGYGRLSVLHGVSLNVRAGEVVSLLGANGAGKTTTLLAIAGELPVQQGEVRLFGRAVKSPLHRRCRGGLAFLPEERAVIRGLSVEDNLRLGRGAVEDALALAPELAGLLKRRAGLLSGGEQQILGITRALASQPRLLVADELSVGLAPQVVERLLMVARNATKKGVGVLLVEQHVAIALAVSDRAYIMRRGEIVLEGKSSELAKKLDEIESAYLQVVADV